MGAKLLDLCKGLSVKKKLKLIHLKKESLNYAHKNWQQIQNERLQSLKSEPTALQERILKIK